MKCPCDIIGHTFTRLTVKEYLGKSGHNHYYECFCACYMSAHVRRDHLLTNQIRSCGCLKAEICHLHTATVHQDNTKHGHTTQYPPSGPISVGVR
jgi:hypothetical protein